MRDLEERDRGLELLGLARQLVRGRRHLFGGRGVLLGHPVEVLYASSVDHVNVAPGRLLNGPARGNVKASADDRGLDMVMTRADLAAWMVAQLTSETWLRTNPVIGY